jgi:hypothetical protein
LRKTRAINQGRNFGREGEVAKNTYHKSGKKLREETEVAKNTRHKSGKKFREGERSCEKHVPHFVNVSGGCNILIPKCTAFIEIKEDN